MKTNDKQYKVYIRNTKQWIPVTEEVYQEYYRPLWRTQKAARKAGRCICPPSLIWTCDGDCTMCEYRTLGNTVSIDAPSENLEGNEFSLLDTIADPKPDFTEILVDRLLLGRLLDELSEQDPEGKRICELIMDGRSEREAATMLNMARSTFKYRWNAIKDTLKQQLND